MLVVPAATPDTIPEPVPIVALTVLLLAHVPPVVELVSVILAPSQTDEAPEIAPGRGWTVTEYIAEQPVATV